MSTQERSVAQRNNAYPVTDNFVKIGNLAYPITHSFVIGEQWVEDPNAPAILECYNFVYTPPWIPAQTISRTSGNFYASMKYAFSNYPIITEGDSMTGFSSEGPYALQWLQELTESFFPGESFDFVAYGIGFYHPNKDVPPLGAIPPVRKIDTKTWQGPNVGTICNPFPGWYDVGTLWQANFVDSNIITHRHRWDTDFVMWVYDWEWELFDEYKRFDPITSLAGFRSEITNAGINDGLFQPGDMGARVISRKFWNAPWERYPHLV